MCSGPKSRKIQLRGKCRRTASLFQQRNKVGVHFFALHFVIFTFFFFLHNISARLSVLVGLYTFSECDPTVFNRGL